MTASTLAALVWRFTGIALVAAALPGVLFLTSNVVAGSTASSQAGGLYAQGFLAASLINTLLIVVGVVVIRSSKTLGVMTASGLQ